MLNFIQSHTPKQDVFFKPFTQRFHSYNDQGTQKFYITPEFGKITRIIGQDIILEGFNIDSTSFDNENIYITIKKGRLIINDTYIEVKTNNTIYYDQINKFDDSGFIVLTASFINEHHLRRNRLRYHVIYFDSNHNSYREFNKDKDKIIFGVFKFSKDENNYVNDFYQKDLDYITLNGTEYKVRNKSKVTNISLLDSGLVIDHENRPTDLMSSP